MGDTYRARRRLPASTDAVRAEQQRKCYDLRLQGIPIRDIAEIVGIPKSTVCDRLQQEIYEVVEPHRDAYRHLVRERYEHAYLTARRIMDSPPPLVSVGGKLVLDEDGKAMPDEGARLQAAHKAVVALQGLCRLDGLDAPAKVDATVTETTQEDLAIIDLINTAKAKAAAAAAELKSQADE